MTDEYNNYVDAMIKWQRELNDALEKNGAEYRVVHIPPVDLIPYEHAGSVTKLQDFLQTEKKGMTNDEMLALLIGDEIDIIDTALMVYKSVLLAVHGNRLRAELREAARKRKKAERAELKD